MRSKVLNLKTINNEILYIMSKLFLSHYAYSIRVSIHPLLNPEYATYSAADELTA